MIKNKTHIFKIILSLCGLVLLNGCVLPSTYPTYKGRVLEMGTNKPIEGAGILAGYRSGGMIMFGIADGRAMVKQAILTDKDGRFEIHKSMTIKIIPLYMVNSYMTGITIFKNGYGNFPGSFTSSVEKRGKIDPSIKINFSNMEFPANLEVVFYLPKLETTKEMEDHNRLLWSHNLFIKPLVEDLPKGSRPELYGLYEEK